MKFNLLRQNYRFLMGLLTKNRPIYLHYAVTHRCNLTCRMCNAWKLADSQTELSIDSIRELARIFARLGCMQVSLGGGEPFMRRDLPHIVHAFNDNAIRVRVLTNGVAPDRTALEQTVLHGLADISISIDSLLPSIQAHIDDAPDTLNRKLETIASMSQLLPKKGSQPMLNAIVSKLTIDGIPALVRFAELIGFKISLIPIHGVTAQIDDERFRGYAPEMYFTSNDIPRIKELYQWLTQRKKAGAPIINAQSFLRLSAAYLCGEIDRFACDAGSLYFSVSPQGAISICHDTESRQSLPLHSLNQLLRDPAYSSERLSLIRSCSGCLRPCWAETSLLIHDPSALFELVTMTARSFLKPRSKLSLDQVRACRDEALRNE